MPVREEIGRFKYVEEAQVDAEFEKVKHTLEEEVHAIIGKEAEACLLYTSIQRRIRRRFPRMTKGFRRRRDQEMGKI